MKKERLLFTKFTILAGLLVASVSVAARGQNPVLVSVAPNNVLCQNYVGVPRVSDNGRWVFYQTGCPDLVAGYRSSGRNIIAHDLVTGEERFVSALPNSRRGTAAALYDVSADGRYAVFGGGVFSQLGFPDPPAIYVRDLVTETTIKIDDWSELFTNASISADGGTVAFLRSRARVPNQSDASKMDLYVWTRATNQIARVDVPVRATRNSKGYVFGAKVSADGRYIVFTSNRQNLVMEDNNSTHDVFRHDLVTNTTTLVSVNSSGQASGNGESRLRDGKAGQMYENSSSIVSADGRYVVFQSDATDLVAGVNSGGVFVRDMVAGATTLVSINSTATGGISAANGLISANGRFVSFRGNHSYREYGQPVLPTIDTLYRRDLGLLQTSVINWQFPNNVSRTYQYCFNTAISADGRYELFTAVVNTTSQGGDPKAELYLTDNVNRTTTLIGSSSPSAKGAFFASISGTGNTIVFGTTDSLVPEDTDGGALDIYVYQLGSLRATITSVR